MDSTQRHRTDPLQVLLVEDNPGDARLFKELVRESEQAGEVWWDEDPASALSAVEERRPDVIALGVSDSEGVQVIERVVGAVPALPIVVLTGQQSEEFALSALEVGATEYLRKDELTPSLLGRTLRWAVERKSMEQTLKERERELRSITENITEGIYRSVPGEGLVYVNQAFADLFGYESPEEITSVDPVELYVRPERREELRDILRREGSFQNEEVECRRKDGTTFTALQSGSVVRDEAGEIVSFDGAVTDITKRREAQRKLEESEKQVRNVLDALAANVAVLDRDGTIIDVNQKWKQFARENDGDLDALGIGDNYLAACAPAEEAGSAAIPAVREEIRAVIEGQRELFEYQYPCHGPDEERWFLLRATPLDRAEGGGVVAHINVTERVQAVRKQRVLSSAVDQAQEGVLITEADTIDESGPKIVYVNTAVEEMTGYAEEELLGQTPRILQGPDTEQDVLDSLREALESGEEWTGETVNYRKNGTPYRVQWSLAPVRGEGGEIEHWVSVQRDVTEERKREKQMTQMAQALDQVGDKVFITDREGRIQYVNEAFEEVTGYAEEEVVGKTPAVLQSGEHDEAFYEELWETVLSGESFRAEFVNEKKDGTRYVEDEHISPVTNEEGEITHFVSAGRDVTERKEREEALRRHRNLLQQTQRLAGAWEADLRSGELSWSEEVYRIHEVEPDTEIKIEDGIEFFAPEARPRILEAFERCEEEGEPYDLEFPLNTTKGNRRWVRMVGAPSETEHGEIVKVAGAFQDITERKQAVEALQEREEYLSVTLQSIGDAVVATDREGCVTEMNSVAEGLTGWSQEEAEGKQLDDVLTLHSARTGKVVESPADEVLRCGETVGLANHTVLTSRDGTEYQIADSAAPIQSEEGDLLGVVLVFRDITEKYERRRRMERQNDLFSKAQDLANVGAWEYDVRSEEAVWTEEVYRIHGLPPDAEVSPEQSLQFYHEEDRPVIEEAFARGIEEGEPYDLELRLITAEGDERWVRTRGEPQTVDGEVVRVRGSIQDVTDRKKYEEELERMTNLLRLAEEMTDVGGWSVDVRGERPYQAEWTDQLYDIFGLSVQEEPPTEEVFEYYHPEDRKRHREAVSRAEQSGEGWDQELRLIRADGTERWMHNIGVPITQEGEVVEIQGAIQDITDRKERERELQETKRRLEKTLESLNEAVLVIDPSVREIVTCNSAVEDIFGYSPEELVGRNTEILHVDRESYERFGDISEPKLEEQGHFSTEYQMRRKDGEIVETENVVTPLKGDKWPDGVVSVIRDITERKERERELRAAKEKAERMNRLKSAFLANMSHEIRTPLTSIIGFAEMIGDEVGSLEPHNTELDLSILSRYSSLIRKGGQRLMETLEDVLDLSKLEAGEMNLSEETVDLGEEATEIVEQFEPQAQTAGLDLRAEFSEEGVRAHADPDGLRIALRNLVNNATKYTEEGGQVWVRVRREDDASIVEVADTGIGMDPERVPELFEAFAQESDGIGREYEGSGLGLTVTKKIVNQMGGSIDVETEKGEGSCFIIRLPRAEG